MASTIAETCQDLAPQSKVPHQPWALLKLFLLLNNDNQKYNTLQQALHYNDAKKETQNRNLLLVQTTSFVCILLSSKIWLEIRKWY